MSREERQIKMHREKESVLLFGVSLPQTHSRVKVRAEATSSELNPDLPGRVWGARVSINTCPLPSDALAGSWIEVK